MKRISAFLGMIARNGSAVGESRKCPFPVRIGLFLAVLYILGSCPSGSDGATVQNRDPETPACTHANIASIEISLPNIIMRRMRQIPSEEGRAASLFLGRHPNIPLTAAFEDAARAARLGRSTIPPGVFMLFTRSGSGSWFSINHKFLHSGGCDERCFINSPKIQQEFADAIAGSFVHEVSHAREIEARPDMPYLQESEIIAYYRENIFILNALKAVPGFDNLMKCLSRGRQLAALKDKYFKMAVHRAGERSAKDSERIKQLLRSMQALKASGAETESASRLETLVLLGKLSLSNSDFEARIRDMYPVVPGVYGDPDMNIQAATGKLEKARADYRKIKAARGPQTSGVSQPDFELSYQRLFNTYENEKSFWSSPERRRKAKEYFELSLTSLRSEMDRLRRMGELKPFEPLP